MLDERIVVRWLNRGQRFFRAVTRNSVIRVALGARGLTDDELSRGWGKFSSVLGLGPKKTRVLPTPAEAAKAMAELDRWDAPNFTAAQAVLQHRAPKAAAFLFKELNAASGPEAVVSVERFLERWEQLRSQQADGVSAEQASLAVELLDSRRIVDVSIAQELRELIRVAQEGARLPEGASQQQAAADEEEAQAFAEYHAWLHEWREIARTTFTRKDYLISLGLASRRSPSDSDDDDEE